MAKPTDGPWTEQNFLSTGRGKGGSIRIAGPSNEHICELFPVHSKGGVGIEQAKANARLIAKARHLPELVEALELMLTYWAAVPENEIGVAGRRTMSKARAALALVQDEDHG